MTKEDLYELEEKERIWKRHTFCLFLSCLGLSYSILTQRAIGLLMFGGLIFMLMFFQRELINIEFKTHIKNIANH